MKTVLKILAAGLLIAGTGVAATSPRVGEWIYHDGGQLEARLYGLHSETVDIGEMSLAIYRGGAGEGRETLVMLHGYSADRQVWPRFAKHLIDRYDIVIPDLAGHGDSPFVSGIDYGAPAQGERVIALLDALKIERAHVIGNSMGGFIAAHLALRHPDRILSATLIDPAGVLAPTPSEADRLIEAGQNPFEVQDRAAFDRFYPMTMHRAPWLPESVLAAVAQRYIDRREALAEIKRGFYHRDMLDTRLGEIRVPVLLLWGREDRLLDISTAPVWAAGIPGAEVEIFDGVGHMPMVEIPEAAAARVATFLSKPRT